MHKYAVSLFGAYLDEIEARLGALSPLERDNIRRELLAHLEDAADARQADPCDPGVQAAVIEELGPVAELGAAFARIYRERWWQGGTLMLLKRAIDLALAMCLLVLLAPLLALIAIAIKLDSRGPIFYQDTRLGKRGRPFTMYKFRTMAPVSQDTQAALTVTRVGRWLRPAGLDELPQLYNVLKGDMSLIGPRPPAPGDVDLADAAWRQILSVPPGVSGLAQLTADVRALPRNEQIALDLDYLRRRSTLGDLRLLLRTFRSVVH